MKILAIIFSMLFVTSASSVYDFNLKNIDGQDFSLAKYKGKKVVIRPNMPRFKSLPTFIKTRL